MFGGQQLFSNNLPELSPKPDVVITIKINLHSKKTNCESGFGFCKVSFSFSWEPDNPVTNGEEIQGKVFINSLDQLVIKLNEKDLRVYDDSKSLTYFKGKNYINVDDYYELGNDVSKTLGITNPIVIKPGDYKLEYENSIYSIIVPL